MLLLLLFFLYAVSYAAAISAIAADLEILEQCSDVIIRDQGDATALAGSCWETGILGSLTIDPDFKGDIFLYGIETIERDLVAVDLLSIHGLYASKLLSVGGGVHISGHIDTISLPQLQHINTGLHISPTTSATLFCSSLLPQCITTIDVSHPAHQYPIHQFTRRSLKTGQIVGISMGVAGFLFILLVLGFLYRTRKNLRRRKERQRAYQLAVTVLSVPQQATSAPEYRSREEEGEGLPVYRP